MSDLINLWLISALICGLWGHNLPSAFALSYQPTGEGLCKVCKGSYIQSGFLMLVFSTSIFMWGNFFSIDPIHVSDVGGGDNFVCSSFS